MTTKQIDQLVKCINSVEPHRASFHSSDQIDIEVVKDAIEIEGIGTLKLPMRPKDVRELIARANAAPYGKGTRTLVDPSVRDSLEIDAACLNFSDAWQAAIEQTCQKVAEDLDLPPDRIRVKPYKLLIYPKGGFFLPHRDSEKHKTMVASLVVMLPSKFGGGELIVQHERKREHFDFRQARQQLGCDCAAFYADCLHEVKKVISGVRVCLSYNLSLKPKRKTTSVAGAKADPIQPLVAAIRDWTSSRRAEPLVFALEHQYTADGLKPDLLKGQDRTTAKHLIAAAEQAECHLHFGQVERHLIEHAMDGYSDYYGYGRRRYRNYRTPKITSPEDLEIMEVIDQNIHVDGWKSATGKKVNIGSLAVGEDSLVSQTPVDQWKPTRFDYEGYTGNAGNTLDRWYHKSAIVVWAEKDHFDVLVNIGMVSSINEFLARQNKLSKRKKPDPEREQQQVQFARAIINGWPNCLYEHSRYGRPEEKTHLKDFLSTLPELKDLELVEELFQIIALRDWSVSVEELIRSCAKHFTADQLFPVISRYLETVPGPNQYGRVMASGLPLRDAQWLLKLATLKSRAGFSVEQLRQFNGQMIQRTRSKIEELSGDRYVRINTVAEVLPLLMKVCIATNDEAAFSACHQLRSSAGKLFTVRDFDYAVCKDLVEWSDKKYARRLSGLSQWLQQVRQFLEQATATAPSRPTNFARSAEVSCNSKECQQLAEFLASPTENHGAIKAYKAECEFLQRQIKKDQLDVTSKIDRSTRPFTLRLQKTTGSFDRATKQYQEDLKLLASLSE